MLGGIGTLFGLASTAASVFGSYQEREAAKQQARHEHIATRMRLIQDKNQAEMTARKEQAKFSALSHEAAGRNMEAQRNEEIAAALDIPAHSRILMAGKNQAAADSAAIETGLNNVTQGREIARKNLALGEQNANATRKRRNDNARSNFFGGLVKAALPWAPGGNFYKNTFK